jgi:nucleotide-binding universal stress UspA family protein
MFERVLLCHDGTDAGRRALKQGAELAIRFGSTVHVLVAVQAPPLDPAIVAGSLGYPCLVNLETDYQLVASQSVERLKAKGLAARGHVAYGNIIENIAGFAKSHSIDLIVVGQYPRVSGRRWWSGPERQSLAESVDCAVLIAVNVENDVSL